MQDETAGASAPSTLSDALSQLRSREIVVRGVTVTIRALSLLTTMRIRRAIPREVRAKYVGVENGVPVWDRQDPAYLAAEDHRGYLIIAATVGVSLGLEVGGITPDAMFTLPDEVLGRKLAEYAKGVAALFTDAEILALNRAIYELSDQQQLAADAMGKS